MNKNKEAKPLSCPKCGASGAEPPGFQRNPFPEAIFVGEEGILVDAFTCLNCGQLLVTPAGSVEVRKS